MMTEQQARVERLEREDYFKKAAALLMPQEMERTK
jgi:hypothetical protein